MNSILQERRQTNQSSHPSHAIERRRTCFPPELSTAAPARSPAQLADDALIRQAQNKDRAAFSELVKKYQTKLARGLACLAHDRADVEDIAQEAFMRAYRALPSFRFEASFYTWLYRIAVNCARKHHSAKYRRAPVSQPLEEAAEDPRPAQYAEPDDASPNSILENKQTLMALNAVLDRMPAEMSLALLLCELEGLSYQEIAVEMACPIGTVRSRISRARDIIADKLAPMVDGVAVPCRRGAA